MQTEPGELVLGTGGQAEGTGGFRRVEQMDEASGGGRRGGDRDRQHAQVPEGAAMRGVQRAVVDVVAAGKVEPEVLAARFLRTAGRTGDQRSHEVNELAWQGSCGGDLHGH